ncbi:hypothetical protein [Methanofollis ethanolicus]|uniref:hypothetical protein n=1 Tax=Methanofollis ethanolicus TaxID=488124 RepID=UPI00128F6DFD|nr:hypothetical protein [Methanofollis ethanolicus]
MEADRQDATERSRAVGRGLVPGLLILFFLLAAAPADAATPDTEADTLLLSAGNYSPARVTEWRDQMPAPSYAIPDNARCFRYVGVFLPEESENTSVDGYYARILPDGRTISYAEVRDANASPADPIAFRARAGACPYSGSEEIEECFRPMITFFDGYTELARHTTVRDYPGIGEVAATTVLYQYPNDGDPDNEYFCTCSCIVETPEDASSGGEGWRNRGVNAHYLFNTTYGDIRKFPILGTHFNPQTSRNYPSALDISGVLFGRSVIAHVRHVPEDEIFWNVKVGYFDDLATDPLHFFTTLEIIGIQPLENETQWHLLTRTRIDMDGGWARIGWLVYETTPASPERWGHALLVRTVPEESMHPTNETTDLNTTTKTEVIRIALANATVQDYLPENDEITAWTIPP